MRRSLNILLALLLVLAQYKLFLGNGNLVSNFRLSSQVAQEREEIEREQVRNRVLAAEVADLKSGLDAIEERARVELGMVRKDEVFVRMLATPR